MSDDKPAFRPHISVRPVASVEADTEDADTDWGSVPPPPLPPSDAEEPTYQRRRHTPPMPPPDSTRPEAMRAPDLPPPSGPRSNPPPPNDMRPRVQSSVGDVVVADPGAIGPGERVPAEEPRETAPPMPPPVHPSVLQPPSVPHVRITEGEVVRRHTIEGMWAPTPAAIASAAPAPRAVARPATGTTPTLSQALRMRVLVAGTPVRLWPFMAVPMMTLFVITGMALGFASTKRAAPADALTSPDATATAAPDAAAEATPQRAASAAPGSEKPREERTSAETIAIAEFESDTKRREIHALGKELLEHPELANDPKKLLVLKAAVYQRDTWLVALEAMAALPGPVGPDLLYRSWTATKARTDATKLAEELVYSKDVRSKASEALSIALDLRAAETCEASKALLPRATEHGDHRSLGELARLLQTRGCGPKKLDDCNACLREGSALDDAIAAAKKRTPPPH